MMRLRRFIAVNFLLLNTIISYACGWIASDAGNVKLYRIMPLDESDYSNYATTWACEYMLHPIVDYKQENLRLWQKQTSDAIRINDIEYVVYRADLASLQRIADNKSDSVLYNNPFIMWIQSHERLDILDYLVLAKKCETIRERMNDPWYYRVENDYDYKVLDGVVWKSQFYSGSPLYGRFVLQKIRALCALRHNEECVSFWNSVKYKLPENVIKTMCELRVAAALNKTGDQEEALRIYAKYGDITSIRVINNGHIDNELEYVYNLHPNSPYLEGEIQKWLLYFGSDWVEKRLKNDAFEWYAPKFNQLLSVAHRAVKEKKSKKMAMWYYTLAALYDMQGKASKAMKYLEQGMSYPQSPFLRDSYRVLRMWLDARTAIYDSEYEQRLMADLKWLVNKINNEIKPKVYEKIKPRKEAYFIGAQYHSYYVTMGYLDYANSFYWNDAMRRILLREVCPRMHKAEKYVREIQLANLAENLLVQANEYSNEMFLIMDRLPYKYTRDYFARIYNPKDEFDTFLNDRGKTDKYYWYDILATKCLRERRYSKAIVYLKQIPLNYQKEMNVYGCMVLNPFSYDMETFRYDSIYAKNCKLHFAEKMAEYRHTMNHHRNPNKRAEAKILYALGLRNSVHRCWFLTRHSSNWDNSGLMYDLPEIAYPEDSTIYRHDEYLNLSDKLINEAINTFTDKEKAARQLRHLLYYKRIINEYGDTETAKGLRQHCDRWRDYADTKERLSRSLKNKS